MLSVHSPWPACSRFTLSMSSNTRTSSPTPNVFTWEEKTGIAVFLNPWNDDSFALKSHLRAEAYLCERSRVESPTYIVAILHPDVSPVSNSMHSPDPANILQKQNGGITLDCPSVALWPKVAFSSSVSRVGRSASFHSAALLHSSESLV